MDEPDIDRTAMELCLQTGGEVRHPIFKGLEMYKTKETEGITLGKFTHSLDYGELATNLELGVVDNMAKYSGEKVGVLLSGGVDSTLLTHLIGITCPDIKRVPFHTVFGIPERNELPHAVSAAEHEGLELQQIRAEPVTQIATILEALRNTKTPSYSIGTVYKALKNIKDKGIDVVVNGLGLDEMFGGYMIHKRYFQRRMIPKLFPFRKTSSRKYRKLSLIFGSWKNFILNSMLINPSLNFVRDNYIDPDDLFSMMKESTPWHTIQRWTIRSMIDHYATVMWRCAKALDMEIVFPYINKELMTYAFNLPVRVKKNKAPIRHLMRTHYNLPELNSAKGEDWNKVGWGGVYEPYFQCENFINIFTEFEMNFAWDLFTGKAVTYTLMPALPAISPDAVQPSRVALQMMMIMKIMEMV